MADVWRGAEVLLDNPYQQVQCCKGKNPGISGQISPGHPYKNLNDSA